MKIDANEMEQVGHAGAADRVDLYVGIHKAWRALMMDVLLDVGRMDVNDVAAFDRVCGRVLELMEVCTAHLTHENVFMHPVVEAAEPGASGRIGQEHEAHGADIARLQAAVAQMRACEGALRSRAALDLYRQLALFVAHNFEHMHVEETAHNAVLWAHYSDAQLLELHGRIVASLPPEENLFTLRWMIPAMTPAERQAVLADMQAHAPAPVFATVLETVRPHLDARSWDGLCRGLGLAPVAGRVAA